MSYSASAVAVLFRPLAEGDRTIVRALAEQEAAGTPYMEVVDYFLRLAFDGRADESRAIVAERAGEVVGLALFGEVAGTVATGRMHLITVTASARLAAVGGGLCDAAVADMVSCGDRLIVAEAPDDAILTSGRALLARCGFRESGRVADYYRDGVDLVILTRVARAPE
jgi:ribosomal protein S18 acetylase RimI-like enzyme